MLCCKWDFRSMFNVIKKSRCFAVSGISEVCSIFKKKSHDALLLVGFQKCVQCLKNYSRCFAGILPLIGHGRVLWVAVYEISVLKYLSQLTSDIVMSFKWYLTKYETHTSRDKSCDLLLTTHRTQLVLWVAVHEIRVMKSYLN